MLHRAKYVAYKRDFSSFGIANIFLSSIIKESFDYKPDKVFVLWDGGHVAHRYDSLESYKSNRGPLEAEYIEASKLVERILRLIQVRSIRVPNTEADDLAYYMALQNPIGRHVSEDQDWMLNLREGWELRRPIANECITWDLFKAKMANDNPRLKFMYYKSLIGDGSDCIDGICGIGHVNGLKYAELLINNEEIGSSKTDTLVKDNIDIVNRNLKIVDTSWVCSNEDIVNEIENQSKIFNRNFSPNVYDSINLILKSSNLAWWKWDLIAKNFKV